MIAYRATLDVPRELVWFVAKLLLAERRRRGTPRGSRALTCFWQAVLGVRWFRDHTVPEALARDHGISRATGYRYVDEVIAVLADQAPDLREALERARDAGLAHVILDGKIIPCDRCKEPTVSVKGQVIDLWYSGKAHSHGGNIQAVLAPDGFPLWISPAEPGSVHDITAARAHALPALYHAAADLPTLADPGYEGAGIGIHIPVKQPGDGRELDINTRTRNAIQRSLRCLGERGFALLTGRWRTLQHITASPSKIGREDGDRASGPACVVLRWCGRRVGGLGPGLTSESADALSGCPANDSSAGSQVFLAPTGGAVRSARPVQEAGVHRPGGQRVRATPSTREKGWH